VGRCRFRFFSAAFGIAGKVASEARSLIALDPACPGRRSTLLVRLLLVAAGAEARLDGHREGGAGGEDGLDGGVHGGLLLWVVAAGVACLEL
jgi:hypothetical protein